MYDSPFIATIDPIIFHIFGPFAIRWYSLSYILGVLFTLWYSKRLIKAYNSKITEKDLDDYLPWSVLAIIIGGRLGHVFIYDPIFYLHNPIDILKTYEGGMSFHGAVIGITMSSVWFCYLRKIPFLQLTDLVLSTASLGIGLGRLANFINGECYGKVTLKPWGVIFFTADALPRHPSQLYEAFLEGFILLMITLYLVHIRKKLNDVGFISAIWCIFYSIFRFISEIYRDPDGLISFFSLQISTGQFLSIIMFLGGIITLLFRSKLKGHVNGY